MPRAGGAVTTLATSLPVGLATDGANLYWGHATSPNLGPGELLVVPVHGGQVTTLATGPLPSCIVVDDDNVYWTDELTGAVTKVAKSGGPAVTLAQIGGFAQSAIALDSSSVYWIAGGVFKVDKGGGLTLPVCTASTDARPACR